jgi:hypothetical protein
VIRFIPPCTDAVRQRHVHQAELQLIYVLKGWINNEFEGHGQQMMSAVTCWLQPPGIKHTVLAGYLARRLGFPVRLIVPGFEGIYNTKWLRRIQVVDRPYMPKDDLGFQVGPDGKWMGEREYDPKSLILYPSGGQRLPGPGPYEIRGLAWTGAGVIRRVEVTSDGGRTWKDAKLQQPVLSKAYTRFVFPWNCNGEEIVIESRCTDEAGRTQALLSEVRKKWGDNPDNWRSSESPGERFSATQPWKITPDGNVHQAAYVPHMSPPPAPGTSAASPLHLNPGWKDESCFS